MSSSRSGFSVLEMVVVVMIVAMVSGVLVPAIGGYPMSSGDAERAEHLETIRVALEAYREDNGMYPTTFGIWIGDPRPYGGRDYGVNGYIPELVPLYLDALPRDPNPDYPTEEFGYVYKSNGLDYKFLAHKTPERYYRSNPYYDPSRPEHAWQISSPGGVDW